MRRLWGWLFAFGVLVPVSPGFAAQAQTAPVTVLRGSPPAGERAAHGEDAATKPGSAPTILRGAPSPPASEPAATPPCPEGAGFLPGYGCVVPVAPGYGQSPYEELGYGLPGLPVLPFAPGVGHRQARRDFRFEHRRTAHRMLPRARRHRGRLTGMGRGSLAGGFPRAAIGVPSLRGVASGHFGTRMR